MKAVSLLALVTLTIAVKYVTSQSNQAAMGLAQQAANSNNNVGKPVFGGSAQGSGNNGRNYQASGSFGAGTKVWESKNGRHAVGVGANYGQAAGRHQGQSWHSRPDIGGGAAYRYRFGK